MPEKRHEISCGGGGEEMTGSTKWMGMLEALSAQLNGSDFENNKLDELSCNSVTMAASVKECIGSVTMIPTLTRSFEPAQQMPDFVWPVEIKVSFSFAEPSFQPAEHP